MKTDRVPPQDIEAERAVLGAMVHPDKPPELVPNLINILGCHISDIFYKSAHQSIYDAVLTLYGKNEPIDLITVTRELERIGILEKVGSVDYLDELMDSCVIANVEFHAKIIKEEAKRRELIKLTASIHEQSFNPEIDLNEILDTAEKSIYDIRKEENKSIVSVNSQIKSSLDLIQALYDKKELTIGIPTGFHELDIITSGFLDSDFIIVAGRPGMGKSMFVQQIALNVNVPVAIFSLEMTKEQIVMRMLSSVSSVLFQNLRTGFISADDWARLASGASTLYSSRIWIDDSASLSSGNIRGKIQMAVSQFGVRLVIIDYLQLMTGKKSENRQQEITDIADTLKAVARDMRIPIIACSQLSRALESRSDKRPMLSDLRESGSLEQNADLVMFLYRDSYYDKTNKGDDIELIIAKQRNGTTGTINLRFQPHIMRFIEKRSQK